MDMRVKTIRIIERESGGRFYMRQVQEDAIIMVPSLFYIGQGYPISYNRYPLSVIVTYPFKIRRMRLEEYFFFGQLLSKRSQDLKRFFDD